MRKDLINRSDYFDINKTLNYNKLWYFIIGGRGVGKTFSTLLKVIQHFLKTKRRSIYIRREKTDIDNVIANGFFDTFKVIFPELTFEIKHYIAYINGEPFMYFNHLKRAAKQKSTDFSSVDYIIFDEFIPDDLRFFGGKNGYNTEVFLCMTFYQTVARGLGSATRDVKFIFLANAVSIANPYFNFFDIDKQLRRETKILRGDEYLVEIVRDAPVSDAIANSRFGKLMSGTAYYDYSVNNKFMLDSEEFIEKISGKMHQIGSFVYDKDIIFIYDVDGSDILYIQADGDNNETFKYTFTTTDHKPNYVLIEKTRSDDFIKMLRDYFDYGAIRFSNQKVKSVFLSCMMYTC